MSILNILNEIAKDPSKLAKEAIVRREINNETLKRVFVAAYDPRVTYGIKKIPTVKPGVRLYTLGQALGMLSDFSSRTLTGNAAAEHLEHILSSLDVDDATVIERIISRDLRMGCSDSTINKVHKNLISEYPYMRYSLFSKVKSSDYSWEDGVFVQTKMDGMYASINHYENATVDGLTRAGTILPESPFADIFAHFKTFTRPGYQYHGEVLVIQDGKILPREIGNGITNSISKGGELPSDMKLKYVIWDMVKLSVINGDEGCSSNYKSRFAELQMIKQNDVVSLVESTIVNSLADAFKVYAKALASGQEGVMLKSSTLMWKDHTTKLGAKLKLEVDVDLVIKGFTAGKGKFVDLFGAVRCESSDGLLKVDVSGFSEEMRNYIDKNRANLLDTIMTVKGNEVMKGSPASIFLPRFAELRSDKKKADTYQQVLDQFENAKQGK